MNKISNFNTQNLSERDRKIIWHPFTQEKNAPLPLAIKKAKGLYLYDDEGNTYMDLISSWWVNIHGHAHPEIADAIYEQAKNLEHVIFAGLTHEPAVQLCENLKTILPPQLTRFFFSDNGSTAVEVAIKMAYQFWYNNGERQRTTFISLSGGYHGDTFGAMSVGYASGFHNQFKELLFDVFSIPFPETWNDDPDVQKKEEYSINVLSDFLRAHHEKVVALICEPLVQGAAGMRMCRIEYLTKIIKLIKSYNILIIFDEVMTGFGRTGKYFATEYLIDIKPDIICLSKGLTGGFMPMSLTVSTESIYEAFLAENFTKALAHGHSYTANPLGCAAAIASFKLLTDNKTQSAINSITNSHKRFLSNMPQSNFIKSQRMLGTIVAFNLGDTKNNYEYKLTSVLKQRYLEVGMLIRPLGNTIYLMPPYCITAQELEYAYNKITEIVEQVS